MERENTQDISADGRIILKRLLKGEDRRTWAELSDIGQGYW